MKTRNILIALCAIAIAAPSAANRGKDGYSFTGDEWDASSMRVTLVEHPSKKALARSAPDAMKAEERNSIPAWSRIHWEKSPDGALTAFCEIHIVALSVDYRPELLGHEMAHCAKGRWHAEPDA